MKGPFPTLDKARHTACAGEHVLARDERFYPNAAWCVMSEAEWDRAFHKFGNEWTHWETKK